MKDSTGCNGFLCTGHDTTRKASTDAGWLSTGNSTKVTFYSDGSVGFTDPGKPERIVPSADDIGDGNGDN